jgi:hypothetical protein
VTPEQIAAEEACRAFPEAADRADRCARAILAALRRPVAGGRARAEQMAQKLDGVAEIMGGRGSYVPSEIARICREAAAALREARAEAWQPIETAPKDGTEILLEGPNYRRVGNWARLRQCWSIDALPPVKPPMRWLPLPPPSAPPSGDSE